ncbi:glycosyltransferase family 9 protein [Cupriavidus sp. AU9028]|nr:glycosyltransferase family 9 protein [Cupriavidus sp. AU9028]
MTQPMTPSRAQRIAVFRALNLGDMLCAIPALRALRRARPQAEITLVGLPWAHILRPRYGGYVDRFVAFPGGAGLPERQPAAGELEAFFAGMREAEFDLALQMHGSGPASNAVVAAFGARRAIGLGDRAPEDRIEVWPYDDARHEVRRCLHLLEAGLGIGEADDALEFPLHEEDWWELQRYPEPHAATTAPYVCLQAGARDPAKRWPVAHFARVGDALAASGYRVVLTGSGAERELARQVADRMRDPAVNAACDISIGGLAALLSGASLLVSNDTGVAHLAAALRVRSVVIFFATDLRRWGPPDNGRHRVCQAAVAPEPEAVLEQALALLSATERREVSRNRTAPVPS